jgi:SOS-response transcriptional repressor LexA
MNFEDITSKLSIHIKNESGRRVFDKDIADAIGVSKSQYATMKKKCVIPYKNIIYFCGQKKINLNWIFFDQDIETIRPNSERLMSIKYFPNVYASCGGGAFNEEELESEMLYLDKEIANSFGMISDVQNRYEAIKIVGDSMEPRLRDGGIAIVDKDKQDIKGDICAVVTTGGLFIKKIVLTAKGMIDLISLNPLYPKESFTMDEVRVVGRIVGSV